MISKQGRMFYGIRDLGFQGEYWQGMHCEGLNLAVELARVTQDLPIKTFFEPSVYLKLCPSGLVVAIEANMKNDYNLAEVLGLDKRQKTRLISDAREIVDLHLLNQIMGDNEPTRYLVKPQFVDDELFFRDSYRMDDELQRGLVMPGGRLTCTSLTLNLAVVSIAATLPGRDKYSVMHGNSDVVYQLNDFNDHENYQKVNSVKISPGMDDIFFPKVMRRYLSSLNGNLDLISFQAEELLERYLLGFVHVHGNNFPVVECSDEPGDLPLFHTLGKIDA